MINAISLLERRPDLPVAAFQRHWRENHAALIARLPGVQRYVQSHPIQEEYQDGAPVCDGIAELWARDSQAFRDIRVSPAYAAVQADEERFLNRARIALVLTQAHPIKEGPVTGNGVKCIRLLKRKAGMPVDVFQQFWRDRHGPRIAALPALGRYVQYHARRGGYSGGREPAYDGFDITWFESAARFRLAMTSASSDRALDLERDFLESGQCAQILAREHVVIAGQDPSQDAPGASTCFQN